MSPPTTNLDAAEILRNRKLWRPLNRGEAVRACRLHPVAVLQRGLGRDAVSWFNPTHRLFRSEGPYLYDDLRYFQFTAAGPGASMGLGAESPLGALKALKSGKRLEPDALEPLEALSESGEAVNLGSPVKKPKDKLPIEFQLVDADGNAVSGAEFEVVLPDGSVRRGKSDAEGFIRIPDNIHKGDATLTLKTGQEHFTADATMGPGSVDAAAPVDTEDADAKLTLPAADVAALAEAGAAALPEDKAPKPVEIQLTDAEGKPLAATKFQIEFPDGTVENGKSDAQGFIRFPDNTQSGELTLVLSELGDSKAAASEAGDQKAAA